MKASLLAAAATSQWTSRAQARDGASFCIRPLRADERARVVAFLNSLSGRSRYLRLQRTLKDFPSNLVDLLMDVDYVRRMALVATVGDGDAEELIAVASYSDTDEPGEVDLGIAVTDVWQGRGVGRLLATELIRFVWWRGRQRMSGVVLPENHRMLSLAKSLCFGTMYDPVDHTMRISRELEAVLPRPHGASGDSELRGAA